MSTHRTRRARAAAMVAAAATLATTLAAPAEELAGMGRLVNTLAVQRSDVPSATDAGQDRGALDPNTLCPLEESTVATLDQIKAETVIPPRARPCPQVRSSASWSDASRRSSPSSVNASQRTCTMTSGPSC